MNVKCKTGTGVFNVWKRVCACKAVLDDVNGP